MSIILYGPDSEPYNLYSAVSPAPGDNGSGGQIAQRGRHPLGHQLVLQDGRKFRFTLNGGTLLVVANVIQGATALSTSEDLTPAAGAVDDRIITFTHGGATTAINLFAEGYAVISVTPGGGDTYKIASHLALRSGQAGDVVNLSPGNALRRAITGTSRVDLSRHPYAGVLQMPGGVITSAPAGVAVSAIAVAGFGWLQTRGACGVLGEGSAIIGTRASLPAPAVNGAFGVETPTSADSDVETTLGNVMTVAASGAWSTIFLTLDG